MTTTTPVEERGQTVLSERAVERIATMALTEVDGVGGAARRVLGIAVDGEDLDRDAQVTARVRGDEITLQARLSVAYPAPVTATTEAARLHLVRRVGELTGRTVSRVDITITALHSDVSARRRVQ
ncbi:Asp23/Gls24 family envelope stress response protein [Amycolatopsis thermalba]|uniref:Asp23/Gls24 family envelope stress response protein n=1 Tax=Amycolatopsis thermalba TaxID=944492 RepID=A0ABY4NUF7_9PSEU|nr:MULTISPECIES: Asp23/Gls24 family envelope stress response protein [Amycolatopsis]UQS23666.1 Asp23/Gls24 family envelope stress response protein [Amycolatopsis thermalba]